MGHMYDEVTDYIVYSWNTYHAILVAGSIPRYDADIFQFTPSLTNCKQYVTHFDVMWYNIQVVTNE